MGTGGLVTRISAGFAQGKHQFALGTIGKDRMESPRGGNTVHLIKPKYAEMSSKFSVMIRGRPTTVLVILLHHG